MRSLVLLALGLVLSPASYAQSVDAHGFRLATLDGDLRAPYSLYRPAPWETGDWHLSVLGEYARDPVVQVINSEFGETTEIPILGDLMAFNFSTGVTLHERISIGAVMPVYAFTTAGKERDFQGPAPGDVRAWVHGLVIAPEPHEDGGGLGVGVEAHIDAPTGNKDRLLGSGGIAGGGAATMTYEVEWFTVTANAGVQFNPSAEDIAEVGDTDNLNLGLGVGFLAIPQFAINLEARSASAFQKNAVPGTGHLAESILSFKYRSHSGVLFTFGGAMGLSEGVGTAQFRGFLGVGYGKVPERRPPDSDLLAVAEVMDQCPGETENLNGYLDEDGCPDGLGTLVVSVEQDGYVIEGATVTVRSDSRNATFTSELAPERLEGVMPGSFFTGEANIGQCLSGTGAASVPEGEGLMTINLEEHLPAKVQVSVWTAEGDPIPSARVFWRSADTMCVPTGTQIVNEQGAVSMRIGAITAGLLVTAPEYKDFEAEYTFAEGDNRVINVTLEPVKKKVVRVKLEKKRIVIYEKVFFETAKATILPESFPLLNDVADTIITNPDIGRVEIAGHTDSVGSDAYNSTLSQQRAESVTEYLVGRGADRARLIAVGYGESRPIATNDTKEGKEQNRRVEFNLIDQTDEPEEGSGDEGLDGEGVTP